MSNSKIWTRVSSVNLSDYVFWITSLLIIGLTCFDLFFTDRMIQASGDLGEHLAAINTWLQAPFAPENPQLVSEAASPRFIPLYFPFVLIGSAFGWDNWLTYTVISISSTLAFLLAVRLFAKALSPSPQSPAVTLYVLLGAWVMPWTWSSVYSASNLYRIVGYPAILAFSLSLVTLAFIMRMLKSGRVSMLSLVGAGFCIATVLTSHVLTGAFILAAAAAFAVFQPDAQFKSRIGVILAIFVGMVLPVFWPFYPVWDVALGGMHNPEPWISNLHSDFEGKSEYILENHRFYDGSILWMIALGTLCAVYLGFKRNFLPLIGICGFMAIYIANAFINIPLGHRFVIYAMFFAHIAIILVLLKLWRVCLRYKKWVAYGCSSVFFAGLLLSSAMWTKHAYIPTKQTIVDLNQTVQQATSEGSIIAGPRSFIFRFPAYGRKVLTLNHVNPLVEDRAMRNLANEVLLSDDTSWKLREIAASCFNVTHLMLRSSSKAAKALETRNLRFTALPHTYNLYELGPLGTLDQCPAGSLSQFRSLVEGDI